MTRILLIRHGSTDFLNVKLCGRLPGIPLNAEGLQQSQGVAQTLQTRPSLRAVYSSPLQRATETAAIIAGLQKLDFETDGRLNEMDFGEWTGLTFPTLATLPAWHRYNNNRSLNSAPGGESLIQVQGRAWESLAAIAERHSGETVAIITHADVIRALLVHFLGIPLDYLLRIEIAPASITEVALGGEYPIVLGVNGLSS